MTLFGPISAVILVPILNSTFFKWAFFVYGIGLEADYCQFMQHNVIALRGEESRKAYFDNRSLSFLEGYRVLKGGVRPLRSINEFDI